METIKLCDIGPIESLTIPIAPGVTVLRGRNDVGKSIAIQAISRLTGGNDPITKRDCAVVGHVEGFGVRIGVRQSPRKSGELEAVSLSGDLNIADLVSPPIKDPASADRHRIKALLQLTGAEADWALFAHLHGVRDHISHDAMHCGDLVEMAAKIKRDLEAASRKVADNAKKTETQAIALKKSAEGIDLAAAAPADILQAALEDAISRRGELLGEATRARGIAAAAAEARRKMDGSTPPDVGAAEFQRICREAALNQAQAAVERIERELSAAQTLLREAQSAFAEADQVVFREKHHAETWAAWRETIAAAEGISTPAADELQAAEQAVNETRQAIERAAIARQAQKNVAEAAVLADEAKSLQREADQLREAARGTDDVLSAAVASSSLFVRGGRLVTHHPERGEVYYAERSDGTRWKLAIDEAIKRIRQYGAEETAIIPIPQAAWSELDPQNKAAIHEYAAELGVTIITAEAADGSLRAETFN